MSRSGLDARRPFSLLPLYLLLSLNWERGFCRPCTAWAHAAPAAHASERRRGGTGPPATRRVSACVAMAVVSVLGFGLRENVDQADDDVSQKRPQGIERIIWTSMPSRHPSGAGRDHLLLVRAVPEIVWQLQHRIEDAAFVDTTSCGPPKPH